MTQLQTLKTKLLDVDERLHAPELMGESPRLARAVADINDLVLDLVRLIEDAVHEDREMSYLHE